MKAATTVMIFDDDQATMDVIKEALLPQYSKEVTCVADSQSVIETILTARPTHLFLPGSAAEAGRVLKAVSSAKIDCTIIAICTTADQVVDMYRQGANLYLFRDAPSWEISAVTAYAAGDYSLSAMPDKDVHGNWLACRNDLGSRDLPYWPSKESPGTAFGKPTPLHLAAAFGHNDVAARLLQAGHPCNCLDACGRTPLCTSIFCGNWEVALLLLREVARADLNGLGKTLLREATVRGHDGVARLIVSQGIEPSLHSAAMLGMDALVLEKITADPRMIDGSPDYDLMPPLHLASRSGRVPTVRLLVEHGANPNLTVLEPRYTPLYFAAANGHLEVVKSLLAAGAMPNHGSSWGLPIDLAKRNGHDAVVALLSEHTKGQDLSSRQAMAVATETEPDPSQELIDAARADFERLQKLIEQRGGFDVGGALGASLMRAAAAGNHPRTMEYLMGFGIDPVGKSPSGETALHSASLHGSRAAVQWLVLQGADVNAQDRDGSTPLICAVQCTHGKEDRMLEVANLLLDAGADPNAGVHLRRNAFSWARENGGVRIRALLRRHGAIEVDPHMQYLISR